MVRQQLQQPECSTSRTSNVCIRCAACHPPSPSPTGTSQGYEDFIAFFLSEEDKTSETALRFW